jgi:hypothetical protein
VATYYLEQDSLRAAETRLRGLLTEYPETDAAAELLLQFGREYERRDDTEGAKLAFSTVVRHYPDGPFAKDAREELGSDAAAAETADPMPAMVGFPRCCSQPPRSHGRSQDDIRLSGYREYQRQTLLTGGRAGTRFDRTSPFGLPRPKSDTTTPHTLSRVAEGSALRSHSNRFRNIETLVLSPTRGSEPRGR